MENVEKNFGEILKAVMYAFFEPVIDGSSIFGTKSKAASSIFESLLTYLKEYRQSVLMSQEFFMWVLQLGGCGILNLV